METQKGGSKFSAKIKDMLESHDPKVRAALKANQEQLVRLKAVSPGTVHQNSTLSNISIQYSNDVYIGTQLMPVVEVPHLSSTYYIYDKRSRLQTPNDAVGSRSTPNEISDNRSTATYSCDSFALKDFVADQTIRNQDAPLDEMVDLTEAVMDVMMLREELRIASVLTTAANFGANTTGLVGTARWDSSAPNIIKNVQDAVAACWNGAGSGKMVGYCSLDVYNYMSRDTNIRDLSKYIKEGFATSDAIAKYLGLDALLVSKSRQDTANEGQTAAYSRIWGKCFGIIRVADKPSIRNASFGYTFRHGKPNTQVWYDPQVGVSGGYYSKVGIAEVSKIVAADTGYLIDTVIS